MNPSAAALGAPPETMPVQTVRIVAPSRLHFGMLSFGQPAIRQFGGAGLMIDQPDWEVRFREAAEFSIAGPESDIVAKLATRIAAHWNLPRHGQHGEPRCRIEVVRAARRHVGLGTGTQLGMTIAAGLWKLLGNGPMPSARALALAAGRGHRSAIGLYGFTLGGLIVEGGKQPGEDVSPLVTRLDLPASWRLLLACPRQAEGLSGKPERQAFDNLPPVPIDRTAELCRLLLLELLPAVASAEFDVASRALFQYGRLAGSCFATQQGGAFAARHAARLVDWFRRRGIEGVGQSSWGPLVFALAPHHDTALAWQADLAAQHSDEAMDTWVAAASRCGATIETA